MRDPHPAIDLETALERTGGDRELLAQIAVVLLDAGPRQLDALGAALARRDAGGAHRAAHTLKGSLGTLGSPRAQATAARIEKAAAAGELGRAVALFARLQRQARRVFAEMQAFSRLS
jgi:HPt (histidine-containing phosphotransfer) domain-containing protein